MTRTVLFLARAELVRTLRARETLLWTFLMPLLFFFFFSKMSEGGMGRSRNDPLRLQEGEQGGFLVDELARRLADQGYAVERIPRAPQAPQAQQAPQSARDAETRNEPESGRVLEVPAHLTEQALSGERLVLRLRREDEGPAASYDDFRVGRAVYTVVADLAALRVAGDEPGPESFARLAALPRALTLEVTPAGKRKRVPSGKQQSIPGTMVMFTLILLLTSGCVPLVVDRRAGLLRRLASAPIARWEVVAGRWLPTFGLGLVQIGYAMLAGTWIFGVDWGPHPVAIVLVLVPWAALVASLALLLGCLARTESQVIGIGVLSSNVLAALGGCWWPIEITPGWMQDLARTLPTGWIMEALHKLISFQEAPASVLPHAALMLAATVLVGWFGARRFRYE